jgi:hypothetical protein
MLAIRPLPLSIMKYKLFTTSAYLVAQLFGRETAEEMREFLCAVIQENRIYCRSSIFLDVRSSRPLFHTERLGLFDYFKDLASDTSCKIALLGDTRDLCISQEYVALLAQQQGLNVRSFRDWAAALEWLNEQRRLQDRRRQMEQRPQQERRGQMEERRGRRSPPTLSS